MTPIVEEWIEKAEKDFGSAVKLMRARKDPNYDLICFLTQQCVEKYLKALYEYHRIPFSKIHYLPHLLGPLTDRYPQLEVWRPQMEVLSLYSVIFRYPGESASKTRAVEALGWCKDLRRVMRGFLGLSETINAPRVRKNKNRPRSR